jgi:hypothetical protein
MESNPATTASAIQNEAVAQISVMRHLMRAWCGQQTLESDREGSVRGARGAETRGNKKAHKTNLLRVGHLVGIISLAAVCYRGRHAISRVLTRVYETTVGNSRHCAEHVMTYGPQPPRSDALTVNAGNKYVYT